VTLRQELRKLVEEHKESGDQFSELVITFDYCLKDKVFKTLSCLLRFIQKRLNPSLSKFFVTY